MILENKHIRYINSIHEESSKSKALARVKFHREFKQDITSYMIEKVWKESGKDYRIKGGDNHQIRAEILREVYNTFVGNLEKMSTYLKKEPEPVLEECRRWGIGKYFDFVVNGMRINVYTRPRNKIIK